jgi:fermentation-respiration switch protein FrsA (DUF1100 family)
MERGLVATVAFFGAVASRRRRKRPPMVVGKSTRPGILLLGVALVGLLMSGCNWLIESQVFFPEKAMSRTPAAVHLPYEDIRFSTSDGERLHGWLVLARPVKYLLVYCHGNAGNISDRVDILEGFHDAGVSVFMFDYRGYGESSGRISEKGFYLDAEAAGRTAREQADRYRAKLIVSGHSLGGIAAVHIGATATCDGVILESTFTNMGAMARAHYLLPVLERWLKDRLNAAAEIDRLRAPVIFFHGDRDEIVPIELGRRLYVMAPEPKEFVVLPGAGHNDTYWAGENLYFGKLREFLSRL